MSNGQSIMLKAQKAGAGLVLCPATCTCFAKEQLQSPMIAPNRAPSSMQGEEELMLLNRVIQQHVAFPVTPPDSVGLG